jgi:hypothetical protein
MALVKLTFHFTFRETEMNSMFRRQGTAKAGFHSRENQLESKSQFTEPVSTTVIRRGNGNKTGENQQLGSPVTMVTQWNTQNNCTTTSTNK